jgi:hypothetical protein
MARDDHGTWPAILDGPDPMAPCFREVPLPAPDDPEDAKAILGVRVFRIGCDGMADGPDRAGAVRPAP